MEKEKNEVANDFESTQSHEKGTSFSAQIASAGQNSADAVVNNHIIPMLINNNSQSISALALCYLSFLTSCMHLSKTNEEKDIMEKRLEKFENMLISLIESEKENQEKLLDAIGNMNIQEK